MSSANWNGRIVVSNTEKLRGIGSIVQDCVDYYLDHDNWKSCAMRMNDGSNVTYWYDILKGGTMKVIAYTESRGIDK